LILESPLLDFSGSRVIIHTNNNKNMLNPESGDRGRHIYANKNGEDVYEATPPSGQVGQAETPEWERDFHKRFAGLGQKNKRKTIYDKTE
jgi:hypothetical protein